MAWGSFSMRSRSLKVPGSLSSALQTRYFAVPFPFGRKDHLRPAGKPAPPRPLRLLALTSPSTCSGDILCRAVMTGS